MENAEGKKRNVKGTEKNSATLKNVGKTVERGHIDDACAYYYFILFLAFLTSLIIDGCCSQLIIIK